MKISIVMAYYNRSSQLKNTLKSILHSANHSQVEVIIVDDASTELHRLENIISDFDLDIKLLRIEPFDKKWVNPCIPFNIGFKKAIGDLIIFQNPECLHVGDIISVSKMLIKNNTYINFGCYSTGKSNSDKFQSLSSFSAESIHNMLAPMASNAPSDDFEDSWYNHPLHRPIGLHFCSAIMREDLFDLGGFDERYSQGIAYDDNDLIIRIQRKKMEVNMISEPFVVHQYHETAPYNKNEKLILKNKVIFENLLSSPTRYKAVETSLSKAYL